MWQGVAATQRHTDTWPGVSYKWLNAHTAGARSEGRRHRVFWAPDYVRNYVLGGWPERPTHYCRIKTPQVLTQRHGAAAKRQSQLSSSGLWSNRKLAQEPNICLFGFTANSAHTISHRFDFGNTQWMSPIITFTNKVQQSVRTRCSFPFIYMELNLACLTMLSLYQTLWNKYLKNKTRICFLPLKKNHHS